jgi:hypothetical protein
LPKRLTDRFAQGHDFRARPPSGGTALANPAFGKHKRLFAITLCAATALAANAVIAQENLISANPDAIAA